MTALDRWNAGNGRPDALLMIREAIETWPEERMIKELLSMVSEFDEGNDREFALWCLSVAIHPWSENMGPEVLELFADMRRYYHKALDSVGMGLLDDAEDELLWTCTDAAIMVSSDTNRTTLTLWLGGPTTSELGGPTTSP